MEIKIRPATENDCVRMMELIHELALYEKAPEQVVVSFEHFVESGFGKQPVWWALVAEVNEKVEGMALYYIRYSTWKGQRMYLEDLVVAENMRGHKIGTLLFDTLIEEARQKKFKGMNWQALDWNEPALNFYRKYNSSFDPEWVNCAIDF